MKRQTCQANYEASSWDELIEFTEAKIEELKEALKTFRRNKDTGRPWEVEQVARELQQQQHSVS